MQPREKEVVLKCGCVGTTYGAIRVVGENQEIQACDKHDGWYKIVREANDYDRYRFYVLRQPAAARKTRKPLAELLRMSESNTGCETGRARRAQQTLF